jgi:hypothetical protein
MSDRSLLRKHLENLLNISYWSPTDHQLDEIARRFRSAPPSESGDALEIVNSVCRDVVYKTFEGADHSDLRALLALALAAAQQ